MSNVFCDRHPPNLLSFYCESCHKVGCYKCQKESHQHEHAEQAILNIQNLQERIELQLQNINNQGSLLQKTLKNQVGLLQDLVVNFDQKNQTQLLNGARLSHPQRIKQMMEQEYSQVLQRKAEFVDQRKQIRNLINKYAQKLEDKNIPEAIGLLERIIWYDEGNHIYEREMERLLLLQTEKQTIPERQSQIKKPEAKPEPIDSKQAITLFKQEKYEEALKAFQKIIDQDANQYKMQYYAGSCLYRLQKYAESLDYFNVSLALKLEGNFDALFENCQSLYELKFIKELEQHHQMMKQEDKDNPRTLLVEGQLLILMKKYEKALQCFETLLSADQNNYDAIFYKLQTLMKQGLDIDQADSYIFMLTDAQYNSRKIDQIKYELDKIRQFR